MLEYKTTFYQKYTKKKQPKEKNLGQYHFLLESPKKTKEFQPPDLENRFF